MDFEQAVVIVGMLLGSGGIIALLKTRSEIRNNNKLTDITAFQKTIKMLQDSYKELQSTYKELQDRYQEIIKDNDIRCEKLSDRLQFLEIEYVKQIQDYTKTKDKIKTLEIQLNDAHARIETLEFELRKRDIEILRLEQQNVELRRQNGQCTGL